MVCCSLLLLLPILTINKAFSDEITWLPGSEKLSFTFKHFSGFFQVSKTHFLHYWLVESQNDSENDPLIFWFNGGPGCSSLDGLLNEMGPYRINVDGRTLVENINAWNKFASIVYIESPAGVGYSYSTDGNVSTDDEQTAEENYKAIEAFFAEFPLFQDHSVYVMGESYAGIYVPTLAAKIVERMDRLPINLKGIALGNGYVNEALNIDTSVSYAYSHGIVDEKTWHTLENECCKGCIDTCDFTQITQKHCTTLVENIYNYLWSGELNPYDLYRDCDPNPEINSKRMSVLIRGIASSSVFGIHWKEQTRNFSKLQKQPHALYGDAPCMNDSAMINYMNKQEVRRAIHIPENIGKWNICSKKVTEGYAKKYDDMSPFIKKIIDANVRVLLYYGDTDLACNFMMGQQFSANLKLPMKAGKSSWKFNRQVGGFRTIYKGLTFITIRGTGHMAPQWKAPQMQYVIKQFINNLPI